MQSRLGGQAGPRGKFETSVSTNHLKEHPNVSDLPPRVQVRPGSMLTREIHGYEGIQQRIHASSCTHSTSRELVQMLVFDV